MTDETYPPKAYRPKHGRLSEHKAEALKKDRRKKLTLAKFVGMAENTAHPRVVIPELRQEFELVGAFAYPLWGSRGEGAAGGLCPPGERVPVGRDREPGGICSWRLAARGSPSHTSPSCSQGPCRRHMEASLQELKSSQRMVPRAVHLPNCDRKGFYKRKQVRKSPTEGCLPSRVCCPARQG